MNKKSYDECTKEKKSIDNKNVKDNLSERNNNSDKIEE